MTTHHVRTDSTAGGDGTEDRTDGPTRAYPTLAAWDTAQGKDITSDDNYEVWWSAPTGVKDTSAPSWGSWVTDLTHQLYVRAKPGYEMLKDGWDDTRGSFSVTDVIAINITTSYITIDGLQIEGIYSSTQFLNCITAQFAVGTTLITLKNCRIRTTGAGGNMRCLHLDDEQLTAKIQNCIFESATRDSIRVNDCTAVEISHCVIDNSVGYGIKIEDVANNVTVKNCASFNNTNVDIFDEGGTNIVIDHCATDDGNGTNAVAPSGSDWDNEYTDEANGDFTLLSGGNCFHGGVVLGDVPLDIEGDFYSWSAPSIGVDEYSEVSFDWNTRVDRSGKPAGVFTETPFPVDENSTSYDILNDENPSGKTFNLGTHYYVDGDPAGAGNDGNAGTSFSLPKLTIQSAVTAAGSGNKAIIVRGAHDSFDGVYTGNVSFNGLSGTDDTHRITLVGYAQERPIIDMEGSGSSAITRGTSADAFVIVQRFGLTNGASYGVRLGWDSDGDKRDEYFNCIDIHLSYFASSACYYLNTDYGWISHCTVDHTFGHGFKIGDGSSYGLIEWCVSQYVGYWSGVESHPDYVQHSSVAIDFPNTTDSRNSHDIICRYNIGAYAVNYALQLRRVKAFTVHHNEFSDSIHHDEITPAGGTLGKFMIIMYAGQTDGDFYSNVVRDPSSTDTDLILISDVSTSLPVLNLYNNLIYGATGDTINVLDGISVPNSGDINISNNSIYADNAKALLHYEAGTYSLVLTNNIMYQAGSGDCLEDVSAPAIIHTYNQYYAPLGSVGITLSTGEEESDPEWLDIPFGAYVEASAKLSATSPARDSADELSGFTVDALEVLRGVSWDMGAYEYYVYVPSGRNGWRKNRNKFITLMGRK